MVVVENKGIDEALAETETMRLRYYMVLSLYFSNIFVSGFTKNMVLLTNKFKPLFCLWVGPVPMFVVCDPSDVQVSPFKTVLKSSLGFAVVSCSNIRSKKKKCLFITD